MNGIPKARVYLFILALLLVAGTSVSWAQEEEARQPPGPPAQSSTELEQHLDELNSKLDRMHQQLIDSQNEMDALRAELRRLREQLAEKDQSEEAANTVDSLRAGMEQLKEDTAIVQAEVKQHEQTKVESASKYPVRVSGTVLFTSILNGRTPDNVYVPIIALPPDPDAPKGSLDATFNQSMLALEGIGPHLWGAKSSADVSVDFWGGSTAAYPSANGSVRLRTAHARLEWPNNTIAVVFDRPLISPVQPTSWVTVGVPALAWSGNLWTWSPQVEFKRRGVLSNKRLDFGFGLIDPSAPASYTSNGPIAPSTSERSKQLGYEARVGTEFAWHDNPIHVGWSGYYDRQAYSYDQHVDGWAAATDWDAFLTRCLEFSGELYRGRAIAGLGSGSFKDYVTYASAGPYDSLRGLDAAGGWAQAKLVLSPSLEVNFNGGLDNAFAGELRGSSQAAAQSYYSILTRNQTVLGNLVYRPKTYLLLSAELRQIRSRSIVGPAAQDRIFGLATGYIF